MSRRLCLTAEGIGEAHGVLSVETVSDFVRAYPASRMRLALIRRMVVGRLPVRSGSHLAFYRRGRFEATITYTTVYGSALGADMGCRGLLAVVTFSMECESALRPLRWGSPSDDIVT